MFNIKYLLTDFGIHIKMKGRVCKHDLLNHVELIKEFIDKIEKPFNVLLDFSEVDDPICFDTTRVLDIGRVYMIAQGMNRLAILYNSNAHIVDLTRVFAETAVKKRERYISTMLHKDAFDRATKYLREGIEP